MRVFHLLKAVLFFGQTLAFFLFLFLNLNIINLDRANSTSSRFSCNRIPVGGGAESTVDGENRYKQTHIVDFPRKK